MPLPAARTLGRISPHGLRALRTCALRMAFQTDPSWRGMQRGSPAAALGTICHEIVDAAHHGRFDSLDSSAVPAAVESEWQERVSREHAAIAATHELGPTPTPERWPGYQMAKVRLVRHITQLLSRPRRRGPDRASVSEFTMKPDQFPL